MEKYPLLTGNHFGGLKGKSTIDVLLTLQEEVYQAWRDKKVPSLVTFDIKGAFNKVASNILINRLRECRIPEQLVYWIEDFMWHQW